MNVSLFDFALNSPKPVLKPVDADSLAGNLSLQVSDQSGADHGQRLGVPCRDFDISYVGKKGLLPAAQRLLRMPESAKFVKNEVGDIVRHVFRP